MRVMRRTARQGCDRSCASTVAPLWRAARVGERIGIPDTNRRIPVRSAPVAYTAQCSARNVGVSPITDCYTAIQATDKIGLPPANATISFVAPGLAMSIALFSPFTLRKLKLANRIVVSPMCQYSAVNGCATDWHIVHWGQLLQSGAGMFTIEATAVSAVGRITHGCLGLYDDACEEAVTKRLAIARANAPAIPVAIQLAHAGRKGSSQVPWEGGQLIPLAQGG